ncbi:MAG: glycerophosphodiester phosphodiesterase [Lachnospiraceae bacterium]|nr:glycerophosphodiester phosphodiesterase [Lachnospiraceae bacterium]
MKEFLRGRTGHPLIKELEKQIYAHRGFHDKPQIPENSIPAFKRAIERGWGAELDVHLLKDGSLLVFHDSDVKRCTGSEGILEDMTLPEAMELRLEGTDERIPLFDEVLELFENSGPLIIELKTYKGNHRELSEAVVKRLSTYKGLFCIESFDPRAIKDVRELDPEIVRGQLACDFADETDVAGWQRPLLTNLILNVIGKPDFNAYRFEDRKNRALRKLTGKGVKEVAWTIRNKEDFDTCIRNGIIPIFEKFDPEKQGTCSTKKYGIGEKDERCSEDTRVHYSV